MSILDAAHKKMANRGSGGAHSTPICCHTTVVYKFKCDLCRKREKAVPHFLINSRFICLIQQFCYYASVDSHSQLSAYSKETHSTSRCEHVEQCRIWDDKTRAAYKHIAINIHKRNHL